LHCLARNFSIFYNDLIGFCWCFFGYTVFRRTSAFFGSCEKWGLIPRGSNPVTGAPKFPENKRERFLSLEEFARLESVLAGAEKTLSESPYVIAMIRLLMHTGCRPGEIQNLQWAWVDLDKRNIRMPRTSFTRKTRQDNFHHRTDAEYFCQPQTGERQSLCDL
jgi:hypothetical protein